MTLGLDPFFLPSGFNSYANKQPYGRYDVTKPSKEEVRLVVTLCPDTRKQLIMLQDLLLSGGDRVNLGAEIFMMVPKKTREPLYQEMCANPEILELFAKAVNENVAIHAALEREQHKASRNGCGHLEPTSI